MAFNPLDYEDIKLDRYETYLDSCRFETKHIKETVENSFKNCCSLVDEILQSKNITETV